MATSTNDLINELTINDEQLETITTTRLDSVLEVSLCIRRDGVFLTFTPEGHKGELEILLTHLQACTMEQLTNICSEEINAWYEQK